jgi:hypothetical protein
MSGREVALVGPAAAQGDVHDIGAGGPVSPPIHHFGEGL